MCIRDRYRIMNIPAVIAIKGGQVAGQQIGLVSKDDMKGFIDPQETLSWKLFRQYCHR